MNTKYLLLNIIFTCGSPSHLCVGLNLVGKVKRYLIRKHGVVTAPKRACTAVDLYHSTGLYLRMHWKEMTDLILAS